MLPSIVRCDAPGRCHRTTTRSRRRFLRRLAFQTHSALTCAAMVGASLAASNPAYALPQGGSVVEGDATITYGENSVTIAQNSAHVIIEWDSFDTAAGESVHFDQAEFMAALNRILSGQATRFDGALTGAGSITIVNQAGIAFGAGANIDVGAITATTLDIINSNFMADNLVFDQYDSAFADASVTNDGTITVADQGLAALVGPGVANNGVIQARTGAVVLASGTAATIDFYGDGLVNFAVTGATEAAPVDADGNPLDALVSNSGAIYADGGTVILAAEAVGGIVDHAINMDGVIQAQSIAGRNGQIALVAGDGAGDVQVAGTLDASGVDAGTTGGTVHVLGDTVALNAGADVNVSGNAGGGQALVGGSYQGGAVAAADAIRALAAGDYYRTSDITYFDVNATVTADATDLGDGGKVIVWADDTTYFAGTISARGGANGGNGGFVETSGAGSLGVAATASVDAMAPNGAAGDWLLDPTSVTISAGGLTTGTEPDILTRLADAANAETLTIDPSVLNNATANVSIVASDAITFSDAVTMTNAGVGLTAQAGNAITVNAAISTNNGNITFLSDSFAIGADVDAGSATVMFDRVTAGNFGLGFNGGVATLGVAELGRISAGNLVIGDPTAAANKIIQLDIQNTYDLSGTITGLVQLNALNRAGSFISPAGTQTYRSVEFNANDGITFINGATLTTTVGNAVFNADADATGVSAGFDDFRAQGGAVAITSAADIVVNAPQYSETSGGTLSLTAAGAITFQRSIAGTIGVGDGASGDLVFSDAQLARMNAATLNFGDPSTPNNTTGVDVNGVDLSHVASAAFNTAGSTTFNGANSFAAVTTSGGATTVSNGATVDASGTIAFNTATVSLNGNLTAGGGINGTATTVNVLGSAGGAEIQDGIGVAAATGATVQVSDGTYAESVLVNKANVIVAGGTGAIIAPASPAFTISADGTTVDGFTYAGTSGDPAILVTAGADNVTITNGVITGTTGNGAGIQIDNTVTTGLNLNISNVTMTGVAQDGIVFDGALNGANIDISGSSINAGRHGIHFDNVITGTTTLIDIFDNTLIEGASQGIAFTSNVTDATIRIRGNGTDASNGIRGPGDAIAVNGGTLTGVTFIVGGDTAADGNFIVSTSQALDIDAISGGRFVVANNDLIQGRPAIEFEQAITNDAEIVIVNNGDIDGGRGIQFRGNIDAATVTIAGNSFTNSNNDAIEFIGGSSITDSTVTIGSTTNVTIDATTVNVGGNTMDGSGNAGADGIDVAAVVQGNTVFNITDNIIGGAGARVGGDGIAFRGGILGTATVTLDGNTVFATDKAIEVDDLQSPSTLAITGGTYDGTGGALLVDNTGVAGTDGRLNLGAAGFVGGAGSSVIEVVTDAGNAGVDIDFTGAATITGGAIGLLLSGPGIDVLNNTLGSIAFAGQTGDYITLANAAEFLPGGPTVIDATGVSFDGTLGSAMTSAELLAVENKVTHFADDNTLGLIDIATLFVVSGESIQTAVNAAGALGGAQTVTVGAGTFGGSVEVWVDGLTLVGAGATTIIDTDAVDPFSNFGALGAGNGFQVAATTATALAGGDATVTGVTIGGFAFGEDAVTATGQNIGVELGAAGASTASGAIVRNSSFTDLNHGIVGHDLAGTTLLRDNSITVADDGMRFTQALGAVRVDILGNTIDAGGDGVDFLGTLTGTTVAIGSTTAADANTIEGDSDGIEFESAIGSGSQIAIIGNTRIASTLDTVGQNDDAIAFEAAVSGATTSIEIANNTAIEGADRGISFDESASITDAALTIRGNTITGVSLDAILFDLGLSNATVMIGGATAADSNTIVGAQDGIDVDAITGGSFTLANNARVEGTTGDGVEFEGAISDAEVTVQDNDAIVGAINGVVFMGSVGGASTVLIDGNGTATLGGIAYDEAVPVDLADFVITSAITGTAGSGILFSSPIDGSAAVTISRNMITDSIFGVSFDAIGSTATTEIHNNFILENTDDGLDFNGDITSRVEVFQNFIADNGGDGIDVDSGAGVGSGNLFVQQNFLPGRAFSNGNGDFAFNLRGTGTPNVEANWWGSTSFAGIATALRRVGVPITALANGTDTNIPAVLGASGLDPFAFQNTLIFVIDRPDNGGPIVDPSDFVFSIPQLTNLPLAPGDELAGRSSPTASDTVRNIFSDPFNIFGEFDYAALTPAAGPGDCSLMAIEGGVRISCGSGGGGENGEPGQLEPGAGGNEAVPEPDTDVRSLQDLLNIWLYRFGTPLDTPETGSGSAALPLGELAEEVPLGTSTQTYLASLN